MSRFWLEPLTDEAGSKYWLLFTHGQFHAPVAVIDDVNMRAIAEKVIGRSQQIKELGEAVKAYRKRYRLTQQEAAKRAGVSRNYLSQIERGEADNLSMSIYRRVASLLDEPAP